MRKIFFLLCLLACFVITAQRDTFANNISYVEIENVRQTNSQAMVKVSINNFENIASGKIVIDVKENNPYFSFVSVEEESDLFNIASRKSDENIKINFISRGGVNVSGKNHTICYLVYKLDKDVKLSSYIDIKILDLNIKNSLGNSVRFEAYDGKLEKNYVIGDFGGTDRVNVLSAMKIIKYMREGKEFNNPFIKKALDVNADGNVDLIDAQIILDYIVGKRDNFLTITTNSHLPTAILGNDFYFKLDASFGEEPLSWNLDRTSRSFPVGLSLDEDKGIITGRVTSKRQLGEHVFTVELTDRYENTVKKGFNLIVKDSPIEKIYDLDSVSVILGEEVSLLKQVDVLYKDGSKGFVDVSWEDVDTNSLGTKNVRGLLDDYGIAISVDVRVVDKDYLRGKTINHFGLLNIHSILLDVSDEVFKVTIDGMNMLYEGNNRFGRNTSILSEGSKANVIMYDRFGNVLQTKRIKIQET